MSAISGWKRWLDWLQPQYDRCVVCSKPIMAAASSAIRDQRISLSKLNGQHKLCNDCYEEIAWITNVMCKRCGRRERCPDCERIQESALWLNRSAVSYNDSMKQWLHQFKFQGDERLAGIMGKMLLPAVEQATLGLIAAHGLLQQYREQRHNTYRNRLRLSQQAPLAWLKSIKGEGYNWDAITAVPLSEERFRERGFNQAELLARVISEHTAIPYYELLRRPQHSERLSHKSRQARIDNIANRYICSEREWNKLLRSIGSGPGRTNVMGRSLRPLNILLVDDVYTTGTTVRACASTMVQHCPAPVKVASVTWARS